MRTLLRSNPRTASVRTLHRDDRGLSTVEYVIILVLIAAAAIGTWTTFGNTIKGKIKGANDDVNGMGQSQGSSSQ